MAPYRLINCLFLLLNRFPFLNRFPPLHPHREHVVGTCCREHVVGTCCPGKGVVIMLSEHVVGTCCLIKVPGHFGILFRWFRELGFFVKIWTRRPPNYYQNGSKHTRNIMESFYNNIIFDIWVSKKLNIFEIFER